MSDGELRQARSGRPIRVLIADDHYLVRRGLREIFAADPGAFEICAEAASGLEAVGLARQMQPDVVVIDVSMPGLNGLETTRQIVKEVPRAAVLILTVHESEQLIEELLKAGARGYVLKSDAARDLPVAIESLYQQRPFFSSNACTIEVAEVDGFYRFPFLESRKVQRCHRDYSATNHPHANKLDVTVWRVRLRQSTRDAVLPEVALPV
jgi:CheY-like chemotaxis protein